MLGAVWSLAADLNLDPDVVLGWRASKVALWTEVSDRHRRGGLLHEMVLLSHAVWDPKTLPKLLADRKPPATAEEAAEALARAERVMGMRMREVTLEELRKRRTK